MRLRQTDLPRSSQGSLNFLGYHVPGKDTKWNRLFRVEFQINPPSTMFSPKILQKDLLEALDKNLSVFRIKSRIKFDVDWNFNQHNNPKFSLGFVLKDSSGKENRYLPTQSINPIWVKVF